MYTLFPLLLLLLPDRRNSSAKYVFTIGRPAPVPCDLERNLSDIGQQ
jgi:hypothetical protein